MPALKLKIELKREMGEEIEKERVKEGGERRERRRGTRGWRRTPWPSGRDWADRRGILTLENKKIERKELGKDKEMGKEKERNGKRGGEEGVPGVPTWVKRRLRETQMTMSARVTDEPIIN